MRRAINPLQNVADLPRSHASPATGGPDETAAPQRKRSRLMAVGAEMLPPAELELAAADDSILLRGPHNLPTRQVDLTASPGGVPCNTTDNMDQPAESHAPGMAGVATALMELPASELLLGCQESLQTRAVLVWTGGKDG